MLHLDGAKRKGEENEGEGKEEGKGKRGKKEEEKRTVSLLHFETCSQTAKSYPFSSRIS